jgi:glutamate synthase domain-containing protein 2/glutamate synthase domain-containing protein 1/glutamate synthase domain-containing protein 3
METERHEEHSACGVGFVASRTDEASREILEAGLRGLVAVEHRGGLLADGITGDGAGVMTDIPWDLFGYEPGSVIVATVFLKTAPERRALALRTFEETFDFHGLKVLDYRAVPTRPSTLGPVALETQPELLHVFIERPAFCRTDASLDQLLYLARQKLRTKEKQVGVHREFFFASLSTSTIVYKALTTSPGLADFYDDLRNPAFKTRLCVFHRRFSTNTKTSWDKVQPFRLIAHNGEINTIRGNRSWSYSREQALGLPRDELLTHGNISDSGGLNEMTEALKYRSSIPDLEDILAIMIPPAGDTNAWYRFWSRALEPWDGPAFIAYSDGESVGGRLDRNGFRPCRWKLTEERFYFASEAGVFEVDDAHVLDKGTLAAGSGVKLELGTGEVHFRDPSVSRENREAALDPRLHPMPAHPAPPEPASYLRHKRLHGLSREELDRMVVPLVTTGKEPIGSMGDTARLAVLSEERRSFFDYFYQTFAQVTNPPLDYLREGMVTDLTTYLGKRPNIFAPKELIPQMPAWLLEGPVLRLGQMAWVRALGAQKDIEGPRLRTSQVDTTFSRSDGARGFQDALDHVAEEALRRVKAGCRVIVLSDRKTSWERPPLPSLLALRAVVRALNREGLRLESSIVVEAGDVRTTHAVAALISFGATAVCPALLCELARYREDRRFGDLDADAREDNVVKALENGLLKIMSKMGISVVRSYQSAKLFSAVGLSDEVIEDFFPGLQALPSIGGLTLKHIADDILAHTVDLEDVDDEQLPNLHLLREHNKGKSGEHHSMTAARSRLVHELVRAEGERARELYDEYVAAGEVALPVSPRHLLELVPAQSPLALEAVQSRDLVTATFGAGAMSFGAINAESQRDIFQAMKELGGRSNSGEGGENPYYYEDGTTASTKQVASGRFGVTAEYLSTGDEIEIKVAQGAKPGEGGQLMGVKVNALIARARFAKPNVDLISPPPLHDIYSIEDLKELIFELKQLHPDKRVCVKLVSGVNIGTIAAGVVKAGADVVQISGGDGGTGAATLTSMRHAGLPWELGLVEVHKELTLRGLRDEVVLRVDGGLSTGEDIVLAAALGGDEFGFGKLMLIAEGCIMARVCEKNTCPRGIATHDERFKKKYRGTKDDVVALMRHIADDVRRQLARVGVPSLRALRGDTSVLRASERFAQKITTRGLSLDPLLVRAAPRTLTEQAAPFAEPVTPLNERVVEECLAHLDKARGDRDTLVFPVRSADRAVLARLSGVLAERTHKARMTNVAAGQPAGPEVPLGLDDDALSLRFEGSAGQGFAVFLQPGLDVELAGEANDSVAKAMSGGTVVIHPPKSARYAPEHAAIIGNCALYGATGGALLVSGRAGDRFAVRNSGATAVVDSVGMHACGYMTGGTVVVLGETSHNLGSGMTGGALFCKRDNERFMNREYITRVDMSEDDQTELERLLKLHRARTQSRTSRALLVDLDNTLELFGLYVPLAEAARRRGETVSTAA